MKKVGNLCLLLTLFISAALYCLAGCGGGAVSNFSSKWKIEISEVTGGKKTEHYIDLMVKGNKFYMHRKEPFELAAFGFGEEGTVIHECDLVYDGKTLWEFNRKTYYEGNSPDEMVAEWNKEQENTAMKMEPDSTTIDIIKFWKIPKGLPTEQTARDTMLGRSVNVLTSRQRSPLGADMVLTFWVDPSSKIILKRQDSTGGESSGKGTGDSYFGRLYTCTEFTANPSFPAGRFEYKPGAGVKVEEEKQYPFSI